MSRTNDAGSFPISRAREHRLNRRGFLLAVGGAAVLTAGAERLRVQSESAAPAPFDAVRLPDLETIEPGRCLPVSLGDDGREALVVRTSTSDVVAYDRRCPHLGCPVVWSAAQWRFECPCHRAAFDARTGAVLHGPATRGLERLRVERRPDGTWLCGGERGPRTT